LESTFRRTTGFVIATFVIMKVRGYEKMPRALRDAICPMTDYDEQTF
jgi:hypothetical protein